MLSPEREELIVRSYCYTSLRNQSMGHIREYDERMIQLPELEWEFIAAHFERKADPNRQRNNGKNDTARIRTHQRNCIP